MDRGSRSLTNPARALLAVILVLAAALVVAAVRSGDDRSARFVGTLNDSAGYARTVARPRVVAATPPRAGSASARRRVLSMPGGWTSDIGRAVAARAERWLGTPYSFAGGDYAGPTYGTPVDEASRNDGHVRGFDCSGLVMYALAPYLRLTHFAASQYVEAGQVHPTLGQLLPGDLVFWSKDGTVRHVGHVAVYIGHGEVVQAPESGDVVKLSPLGGVEAAVIGTTRPLTSG